MADSFLDLVNGVPTLKPTVASSAGAGDAGKIPRLGAAGLLDPSMMPMIPGSELIRSETASNDAYLLFDDVFSSTFDVYEIHFVQLRPVAEPVTLFFRWRDAGADVTGTTHYTGFRYNSPLIGTGNDAFTNSTSGHVCPWTDLGNGSGKYIDLVIRTVPRSTLRKSLRFSGHYLDSSGGLLSVDGLSTLANTTAMSGFKVLYNTNNIASGKVAVYGYKI